MPTDHPPRAADAETTDSETNGAELSEKERLVRHRGLATWGERLVPLARFRTAAARRGTQLDAQERLAAEQAFVAPTDDGTALEGPFERIVVFGGIYNNHVALQALIDDATAWGADAIYCLGDFGGFGPSPNKVWPLLERGGIRSIQGNYEQSLSSGAEDCNCGYADPRDNHFAELSYLYTAQNTSDAFKQAMGELPLRRRVTLQSTDSSSAPEQFELLLIHGSPRRINEFLFESATPDPYLEVLLDQERADAILCTHTGLQWQRRLASGRSLINAGVIGRPANDGAQNVWSTRLEVRDGALHAEHVPLHYDSEALATEMRQEQLPEEFVDTILSGWWTTCLEILPAKERASSRF